MSRSEPMRANPIWLITCRAWSSRTTSFELSPTAFEAVLMIKPILVRRIARRLMAMINSTTVKPDRRVGIIAC